MIPDRPIQWTHIGGGKGFNALQQQLQQLPANLTVHLTGAITNREVIGHYLHHPVDIFVNVSASEGLPVSIMEANQEYYLILTFPLRNWPTRLSGYMNIKTVSILAGYGKKNLTREKIIPDLSVRY